MKTRETSSVAFVTEPLTGQGHLIYTLQLFMRAGETTNVTSAIKHLDMSQASTVISEMSMRAEKISSAKFVARNFVAQEISTDM